jgi:hypothetical protein
MVYISPIGMRAMVASLQKTGTDGTWQIEEIIKRRGNKEIHIKRSRRDADNYRGGV